MPTIVAFILVVGRSSWLAWTLDGAGRRWAAPTAAAEADVGDN